MSEYRTVRIPEEVARTVEANLELLSARSLDEYVAAVVREKLRAEGLLPDLTPDEERELERRLRDLGYLD
ncbi:MAG: hypothetical protein NUV94_00840 [Candidatus Acetothermia bacterium]|jgi:hypothetical protein|nr:hypothetical protein [Candidatus Acetothermia bacterium]